MTTPLWEHCVHVIDSLDMSTRKALQQCLQARETEGWELCSIVPTYRIFGTSVGVESMYLAFKRPRRLICPPKPVPALTPMPALA